MPRMLILLSETISANNKKQPTVWFTHSTSRFSLANSLLSLNGFLEDVDLHVPKKAYSKVSLAIFTFSASKLMFTLWNGFMAQSINKHLMDNNNYCISKAYGNNFEHNG